MRVVVHPRIGRKRPQVTEADVEAAFMGTLRKVVRRDCDPPQWVGVGLDGSGRLLEYVAVEIGVDEWLVFHAMPATVRVQQEVGLLPRRR